MSLQILAQDLAARGRNNDSMLVHMTPSEVKGLQGLAMAHGGSLTINPQTGLPEAGFLSNILPTILGFALTPFMGPLAAGLLVGGGTALATGNISKGLMAGLGAWGGGGLGEAFGAAGAAGTAATTAAANTATAAALPAGATAAEIAAQKVATDAIVKNSITGATAQGLAQPTYSQMWGGAQNMMGSGIGQQAGQGAFMGSVGGGSGLIKAGMSAFGPTLLAPPEYKLPEEEKYNYVAPRAPSERTVSYPGLGRTGSSEWTYFSPSNPIPYAAGGEAGLGALARGGTFDDEPGSDGYGYADGGDVDREVKFAGSDYQAGAAPEFNHNIREITIAPATASAAPASIGGKGAIMSPNGQYNGNPTSLAQVAAYSLLKNHPEAARMFRSNTGMGDSGGDTESGFTDMSGMKYDPRAQRMVRAAGGRYLQGAGDGTSDSIPAVIGNSQPARLADGEFVVDARTVSEIGNGSSNAGARKLYAMMDRVRKARKTATRGKDSNADRYLPA